MPLAIDLYSGLGGWAHGLLAEGFDVVGFDIERHEYDGEKYPGQLVLQDVLTLDGAQFKNADLIVASPPCTEYSYMAMPWSRAKQIRRALLGEDEFPEGYKGSRTIEELNALFNACFRIQREASEAAGRHIPLIVENVRGAQEWVGRARWNYGSFYLWGDVPALMPMQAPRKLNGFRFDGSGRSFQTASVEQTGYKSEGLNWSDRSKRGQDFTRVAGAQAGIKGIPHRPSGHWTSPDEHGRKNGGDWFDSATPSAQRKASSGSKARKAASARIAKIPFPLSQHIAQVFK